MTPSKSLKFVLLFVTIVLIGGVCKKPEAYYKLSGKTMGTYYSITYQGTTPSNMHQEIEAELIRFNDALSTYIPSSTLSQLNESKEGISIPKTEEQYFTPVFQRAEELYKMTNGVLNPSISPIVNYWGFGFTDKKIVESENKTQIDSLLFIVENTEFKLEKKDDNLFIKKSIPEAEIDFSSLAKGYGIDVLAKILNEKNIQNYLIDIGGEARAKGVNDVGKPWTLAINSPKENSETNTMELALALANKSLATSGNYRQFYIADGKKYAHIIDPKTGYPALKDLLSATIIADDCMTADGLATSMMVMGLEEAKKFLSSHTYPACLIYDADGDEKLERYYANGFEEMVVF